MNFAVDFTPRFRDEHTCDPKIPVEACPNIWGREGCFVLFLFWGGVVGEERCCFALCSEFFLAILKVHMQC